MMGRAEGECLLWTTSPTPPTTADRCGGEMKAANMRGSCPVFKLNSVDFYSACKTVIKIRNHKRNVCSIKIVQDM